MTVCKFGGSSVCNAEKFKIIRQITKKIKTPVIVLSAVGKDEKDLIKTTDLLISACKKRKCEKQFYELLAKFYKRYLRIASELNVARLIKDELEYFVKNAESYTDEYIISRGEYFTAKIYSAFANVKFVDSKDFMRFTEDGVFLPEESKRLFFERTPKASFVTCGFYGSDGNGNIKLFERGGGDVTAAHLCSFCDENAYYNFTDVDGIYDSPPFCKNKSVILRLGYAEAYFLTKHGDCVLTPASVLPLIKKRQKVIVLNSNQKSKLFTETGITKGISSNSFSTENNLFLFKISISEKILKSRIIYSILKSFMTGVIKVEHIAATRKTVTVIIKKAYKKSAEKTIKKYGAVFTVSRSSALHFAFKSKRQAKLKTAEIEKFINDNDLSALKKTYPKALFISLYFDRLPKKIVNEIARIVK